MVISSLFSTTDSLIIKLKNMALDMKTKCEKCGKALPWDSDEANICSYECTFCNECAKAMKYTCPNCKGELLERPRRNNKQGF